jgi:predicted ABC-type ATPase
MRNFLARYRRLADVWALFDNSGKSPETVAFAKGDDVRIIDEGVYSALVGRYGRI